MACKFLFDKRLQSTQTGGDLQGNNDHKSLFSIDLYISQKAYVSRVKESLSSVGPAIVSENGIVSGQITKEKQLLDTKQAAQFLGISRNTLYEWIIQKKIPYVKVGRLVKFRREHLEKWLEKKLQKEEDFDILGDD